MPSHFSFLKTYYGYYYMGKKTGKDLPAEASLVTLRLWDVVAHFGKQVRTMHVSEHLPFYRIYLKQLKKTGKPFTVYVLVAHNRL